jgi:predicted  nucleic acid-binding Zn-ribbon protein
LQVSSSVQKYTKLSVVPIIFAICVIISGCSDDSQHAQKKQTNEAVKQALETYEKTGDFDKARAALQGADSSDSEIVRLIKADLDYGKAGKMQSELAPYYKQIDASITEMTKGLNRITQLNISKEQIESQVRAHGEEAKILNERLNGDSNQPGLLAELQKSESELNKLKSERDSVGAKAQEAQKQADAIQAKADELLRKAETASADEKARLSQEAYSIIRGTDNSNSKTAYLKTAQDLQDQANVLQSEINMLEPKVKMLKASVEKTQQRLAELEKSETPGQSSAQAEQINSNISGLVTNINAALGQLTQAKDNLNKKVEEINELYGDAYKSFSTIRDSDELTQLAKVAAADTAYKKASTGAEYGMELRHLAARLAVLPQAGVGDADRTSLAEKYSGESAKFIDTALTDFNDAAETYSRVNMRELAGAVVKNQLLALTQRAYIADKIENPAVKTQSLIDANSVVDRGIGMDPSFAQSEPAKFFYQLSGKTPPSAATVEPNAAEMKAAKKGKKAKPEAEAAEGNVPAEANAAEPSATDVNTSDVNTAEPNAAAGTAEPNQQ